MIIGRLAAEVRDLGFGDWSSPHLTGDIPPPGEDGITFAGPHVSEGTAMRLSSVFACSALVTNAIATLPTDAFHKEQRPTGTVRIEDPMPKVLEDPHPEMDPVDFWSRIIMSLLHRGNGYGYITALSDLAWPTEMMPIHPDFCRPRRNRETNRIEYRLADGSVELAWPNGPIWHVRGLAHAGAIEGISVIEAARQGIGLGLSAEEYGARFFGDSATPSGALTVKEDIPDSDKGRERAKRIIGQFRRTHGRRHLPALLTNGATWQSISVTPNEAQFLETRRFQLTDICRFFLVPPHLVGEMSQSTVLGSSIAEVGIGLRVYTLATWIVRLEQAFRRLLPGGQYMRFNVAGLERGDFKSRMEGYAQSKQWGLLSTNDINALEDRPPVEGGDQLLMPLNMRDAAELTLQERADAYSKLVTAGVDPADAAKTCNLPPMKHTGKVHQAEAPNTPIPPPASEETAP